MRSAHEEADGRGVRAAAIAAGLLALVLAGGCGDDAATTAGSATDSTSDDSLNPSGVGDGFGAAVVFANAGPDDDTWKHAGGWTITYDRLLVALGDVEAASITAAGPFNLSFGSVVDLVATPHARLMMTERVAAGAYAPLAFVVETPSAAAARVDPVAAADRDAMITDGVSLVIEGAIADPAGLACDPSDPSACQPAPTVTFRWRLPVSVRLSECATFSIMHEADNAIYLDLAIDAWLRTGFTDAAATAPRAAQWIADADLDRDGETTLDELKKIAASDLFTADRGYDLSGAPIPIDTAYDVLLAQAMMLGAHDGACARVTPLAPAG